MDDDLDLLEHDMAKLLGRDTPEDPLAKLARRFGGPAPAPAAIAQQGPDLSLEEEMAKLLGRDQAPKPAARDSNLTVIGRYESEGTSYVMYSDGSIEAQSDAGSYRFDSMKELKDFIEG